MRTVTVALHWIWRHKIAVTCTADTTDRAIVDSWRKSAMEAGIMTRGMLIVAVLALLGRNFLGAPALQAQPSEDGYRDLLGKYVTVAASGINLVDYAKWKKNKTDLQRLDAYLAALQSRQPSTMARNQAFVFWVNLYNAATLKILLDNYPVKSIRDIKSTGTGLLDFKASSGPWRTKHLNVEGVVLSLDDIEHNILRPSFKDPRVHYAINCASIGCPNLKRTPWTEKALDADLEAAARDYVNHPRGASTGQDGSLRVSSIYHWFKEDFGGGDKGVIAHLLKYASPELTAKLAGKTSIAGHDYDWSLNALGGK